jgi:hypothetical protein
MPDEIAVLVRTTWARVKRDIEDTQRLLNEARDLCRARGENFDKWCTSGKLGISRSQIYNLLAGRGSSHLHRVEVYDVEFRLTPPNGDRFGWAWLKAKFGGDVFDPCPYPDPRPEWDGLEIEWKSLPAWNYCNPMFKNPGPFYAKCIEEYRKGKLVTAVVPANAAGALERFEKAGAEFICLGTPD